MRHPYASFLKFFATFLLGAACTFFVLREFDKTQKHVASQTEASGVASLRLVEADSDPKPEYTERTEGTHLEPSPSALTPTPANDLSSPIPLEWEQPLFAILNQTNPALRNQGLINMALNTALHFPRIQAECVKHLTYSLSEEDYAQFLLLIRNPALPVDIKSEFLSDTLRIRRSEFAFWLASSLANDPQVSVASLAKIYLNTAR